MATSTPEPGVYHDVPFAEYLAWEADSNSRMGLAARSLAHYRAGWSKEPTPAMRLGSLVHCGKLEPLAVAERYVVMPNFHLDDANVTAKGEKPSSPRSTGYYKDKVREFQRVNADKEVVDQDQYDRMLGIVRSLATDAKASVWFNEPGFIEVSLVWVDEDTGRLCKCRIDKAKDDWSRITDLKTCEDARKFPRSISTYGYHRQMAHYSNGVKALQLHDNPECCLVAVETEKPFLTDSRPLHEEALVAGRQEVRRLLCDIAEAIETNKWPGYKGGDYWRLPAYHDAGDAQELIIGGEVIQV